MTAEPFDAAGALEAVDRILNRGGDCDQVLREVLDAVHARCGRFIRIRFVGVNGEPVDAFAAASRVEGELAEISYGGELVGTLEAAVGEPAFVQRLSTLISAVAAESAQRVRRR
jgi:hypothetical protein